MTREMIERLMAAGLSKQMASSATAEAITNYYMGENGQAALIKEAHQQVREMRETVRELRSQYDDVVRQMQEVTGTLQGLKEAQEQYGEITDDRARNAIALYLALISVAKKAGADGEDAVENAGYILYAYFGGMPRSAKSQTMTWGER